MDQKGDNKAAKATFLGGGRVVIWWCLGAAVEELGGWIFMAAHGPQEKRKGGKGTKGFQLPKVLLRSITPPLK